MSMKLSILKVVKNFVILIQLRKTYIFWNVYEKVTF